MELFRWRRWWSSAGLPALRVMAVEHWDPQNVYDDATRADAYDAYLERVGRMLRRGMAQGVVRQDLDADFAVQFWLQSLNGLVQPKTLEQLGLTPRAAFENGVRLFFWAVLTEAGRADFAQSSQEERT